jgi:hypothetical protein
VCITDQTPVNSGLHRYDTSWSSIRVIDLSTKGPSQAGTWLIWSLNKRSVSPCLGPHTLQRQHILRARRLYSPSIYRPPLQRIPRPAASHTFDPWPRRPLSLLLRFPFVGLFRSRWRSSDTVSPSSPGLLYFLRKSCMCFPQCCPHTGAPIMLCSESLCLKVIYTSWMYSYSLVIRSRGF